MKKCAQCGKSFDTQGNFCPVCGGNLINAYPPVEHASNQQPNDYVMNAVPANPSYNQSPAMPQGKPKNNKKTAKIIIAVVLAVVIAVGGIFAIKAIPALNNPFLKIYSGFMEIFTSDDTYNIDVALNAQGAEVFSVEGLLNVNCSDRTASIDGSAKIEGVEIDAIGHVNEKEELVIFEMGTREEIIYTFVNGLYGRGDFYAGEEADVQSTVLDVARAVFDLLPLLSDPTKMDSEKIYEALPEELKEEIDEMENREEAMAFMEELSNVIAPDLIKKFSDTKWLKEEMGYEKSSNDGKVYSFDFSCDTPVNAVAEVIEADKKDIEKVIAKYEDVLELEDADVGDLINELEDAAKGVEDVEIAFSATIKDKYLSNLDLDIKYQGEDVANIQFSAEKTTKKIDIDVDEYKAIAEDYKKAQENDNYYDEEYYY